ncbi:retrovirus-related Pol polyprotein from transposon opus [Trichonephila clavipes]|nr:retrovirus-related Pol polyprotein from transposon opus [Trichonephila clavipes]
MSSRDNPNNVGIWGTWSNRMEDFNLKIDDSRYGVVPIMCAVSKRLVNNMLDCSSAYEALLQNACNLFTTQRTPMYLQGQLKRSGPNTTIGLTRNTLWSKECGLYWAVGTSFEKVPSFTRWAEAIPVKEISAKTTYNVLLKIVTQTGFLKMICSDQGTNFTSKLSEAFLSVMGVSPRFSTPRHPESMAP